MLLGIWYSNATCLKMWTLDLLTFTYLVTKRCHLLLKNKATLMCALMKVLFAQVAFFHFSSPVPIHCALTTDCPRLFNMLNWSK